MRMPSGRAATATLLVAALAALLVAGRLLVPAPRATSLPDLRGQRVAQAAAALRRLGLEGHQMNLACVALDHGDPAAAGAVVVAQDPRAGEWAPRGGAVALCARTDVQPNNIPRRVRLGPGSRTAAYLILAPAVTTHRLTVLTVMPAAARVEVWVEPGPVRRLPVLAGTGDAGACRPTGGQVHCRVELGALGGEEPGPWVVRLVKRSPAPADLEVTAAFAPR
jgi:hypothetical protein